MAATKTKQQLSKGHKESVRAQVQTAFDLACQAIDKLGVREWTAHDGSMTRFNVRDAMLSFLEHGEAAEPDDNEDSSIEELRLCLAFIDIAIRNSLFIVDGEWCEDADPANRLEIVFDIRIEAVEYMRSIA